MGDKNYVMDVKLKKEYAVGYRVTLKLVQVRTTDISYVA